MAIPSQLQSLASSLQGQLAQKQQLLTKIQDDIKNSTAAGDLSLAASQAASASKITSQLADLQKSVTSATTKLTSSLSAAGLPDIGSLTSGLPSVGSLTSGLPSVGSLTSGLPSVGSLTSGLSGGSLGLPSLASLPSVPSLSGIGIPSLGSIPALPSVSLQGFPKIATGLPGMPSLDSLSSPLSLAPGSLQSSLNKTLGGLGSLSVPSIASSGSIVGDLSSVGSSAVSQLSSAESATIGAASKFEEGATAFGAAPQNFTNIGSFGSAALPAPFTASQDDAVGTTTYFGTSTDTSQTTGSQPEVNTDKNHVPGSNALKLVPNPLHDFVSSTYFLALHALTKDDYNSMVTNPGSFVPQHTLIASGGKRGVPGFERDTYFNDDFYFEDFKLSNIIGLVQGTAQGTNAVTFSFTLIEPYGMTLIDRLIEVARKLGTPSYIEMAYVIEINFVGYNDDGTSQVLQDQKKFIPIKINGCKIKVNTKGAEYQIEGTISPQMAFSDLLASTPANFEVAATTLDEFFASGTAAAGIVAAITDINQRAEAQATANTAGTTTRTPTSSSPAGGSAPGPATDSVSIGSYVQAYNAWQIATKKSSAVSAFNEISVNVHPTFTQGDGGIIIRPTTESTKQVAEKDMSKAKNKSDVYKANARYDTARPDLSKGKFTINKDTTVMAVINQAMQSSNFIRKQVINPGDDPQKIANEQKSDLIWWKIIPSVILGDFDTASSRQTYKVTYNIVPYTVHNQTHPDIPITQPSGWVKEYNWIYTGKNNDIIDFTLELDSTYYTAVTIDAGAKSAPYTTAEGDQENININTDIAASAKSTNSPVAARTTAPVTNQATAQSSIRNLQDPQGVRTSSVAAHVMNGGADTIQVTLKIVGDPTFVKQDETFYAPNTKGGEPLVGGLVGGSISTDGGEVIVKLTFNTPVDIDDSTGGLKDSGSFRTSAFSGLYKIIDVENTMSRGKFEQALTLIRILDQPHDYESNANADTNRLPDIVTPVDATGSLTLPPAYDQSSTPAGGGLTTEQAAGQANAASTAIQDQSSFGAAPQNFTNIGSFNTAELPAPFASGQDGVASAFGAPVQSFPNIGSFNVNPDEAIESTANDVTALSKISTSAVATNIVDSSVFV